MKNLIALMIIMAFGINVKAQDQNIPRWSNEELKAYRIHNDNLNFAVAKMLLDAKLGPVQERPCTDLIPNYIQILKQNGFRDTYDTNIFMLHRMLTVSGYKNLKSVSGVKAKEEIDDKVLEAFSNAKSKDDFIQLMSGKTRMELLSPSSAGQRTEYTSLYNALVYDYDRLKNAFYEYGISEGKVEAGNGCEISYQVRLKIDQFKYPNIVWDLSLEANLYCECIKDDPTELESATFLYTAKLDGKLSSNQIEIDKNPINPKLEVARIACCGDFQERKELDDPIPQGDYREGQDDLPDEDLGEEEERDIPDQLIGGGVGLGLEDNFEEFGFCFMAEYLKEVKIFNSAQTHIGADVGVNYSSREQNSFTTIPVGGKIQNSNGITKSKESYYFYGARLGYEGGSNTIDQIKYSVNGVEFQIYGGLMFRITKQSFLGFQFPVITYVNRTTKADSYRSNESQFDLILNKENPLLITYKVDLKALKKEEITILKY